MADSAMRICTPGSSAFDMPVYVARRVVVRSMCSRNAPSAIPTTAAASWIDRHASTGRRLKKVDPFSPWGLSPSNSNLVGMAR